MIDVQTAIVDGIVLLRNFEEVRLVTLPLNLANTSHNVLILGKVVIRNDDGDFQYAMVRLTFLNVQQLIEIDRADAIRLVPYGAAAVTLMGWVTNSGFPPSIFPDDHPFAEIRASTYWGIAEKVRLTVTVVDTIT